MARCALIVDDNRSLAEDLGEILSDEGYQVHVFDDPLEALERSKELDFQLAVLDVRMPGMDGVSLHQHLKDNHPEARFVLMTAYAEDHRLRSALEAGVSHVLTKPVPLPQLLRIIEANGDAQQREILLVDDDRSFNGALAEALEQSGYRVRRASTAAEARAQFAPELLATVVDVRLPDADGVDLAVEMCRRGNCKVVLISGYDIDGSEQQLLQNFGQRARVLVKPFSPHALLRILSELRGAQA